MFQKIHQIMDAYDEIDQQIESLQRMAGNSCPNGCGNCCHSPEIEATLLECLPIVYHWIREGKEESILRKLEEAQKAESPLCVAFIPDPEAPGMGRCMSYEFRPTICRLFGFAGSRNKNGEIRFTPCIVAGRENPEISARISMAIRSMQNPPVFHDLFQRVATIDPNYGYQHMPINQAFLKAFHILSWYDPTLVENQQTG